MEKKILVTRSSLPPLEEYIDEIRDIWDSHWLTNMGSKHECLIHALQQYLEVEHLHLLVNGHMALELSLQALKLTGEVITTPFTFASTTHAIVRNNLTPVFCDIRPDDFTIDTNKLENLITDKTTAIMPVHVYGNICNVEEIQRIADKYGLKVIYDAAHAFGEKYKGQSVANFGDVSCFSFHATKVFHTIEGGASCYSDRLKDFGLELYRLKNFGIRSEEVVDGVGANAKMNEFAAAMGLCNLRHIDDEISKRGKVVAHYRKRLDNVPGLRLNPIPEDVISNYAYFPVVFEEHEFGATRNEVVSALAKDNIYARKYFYPLTNDFECYRHRIYAGNTPVALHVAKRVLTLPLYADLKQADVDRICDIILRCGK
ncbi:DegT/DnrJ/EryC1/StrS family aminotransferase [Selenomonas sp. KH1T6]|uniref:DegT/DnrJ/EryC1/StrS family aminotransferase n=1 Tax=Selenomonas sp. KH1T6 TaxID=3158784 RepID=UPI0008A7C8D2|nr:dTDP-4-amino-4,6-dideoxygalactose transaminase [Selenomonas ruminantium]